jgi:hypothetical protein
MKNERKDLYGDAYTFVDESEFSKGGQRPKRGSVASICVNSETTNAIVLNRDASIELGLFLLNAAGVDVSMVKP